MVKILRIRSVTGIATIQDIGRYGFRNIGVPVAGALDRISYVYSNVLIGNNPFSAVIEVIGVFTAEVLNDTIICVTGGAEKIYVNGIEHNTWKPVYVKKGSVITIKPGLSPLNYLSMYSGIKCPMVLGSRSTYLRGKIGCYPEGLNPGLILESYLLPEPSIWYRVKDLEPPFNPFIQYIPLEDQTLELRATPGVHSDLLWDLDQLFKNYYYVSHESDRLGYRLEGSPLKSAQELGRLPSIPVDRGYVQVPPNGKPIVLMSDSQTMGGYAVALHVLQPDIDRLAHCQPGYRVLFKDITYREAEDIMSDYLQKIQEPIVLLGRGVF